MSESKQKVDPAPPHPVPQVILAIQQVQAAFARDGLAKDRDNKQQGYKFRGIDDVYNSLSNYLVGAGLVIVPHVRRRETTERQSRQGGALIYTTVEVEYEFISSTDGSRIIVGPIHGEAMDSGDKSTNKAMSAAYKYLCLQTFCIPTEGDNDADASTHEVAPRPQRQSPRTASLEEHMAAMYDARTEAELKRVFAKAWRQFEHPNDPRTVTPEQQKLKAYYDDCLDALRAGDDTGEPSTDSALADGGRPE